MAQELLSSFADELDEVSLRPASGGIFTIVANEQTIWDRATDGGFPDIKTLKQKVRDVIVPDKDLGHIDH